jgi:IS605 OrfB family transposase
MITYNTKIFTTDSEYIKETLRVVRDMYNFISTIVYESGKWEKLQISNIHKLVYEKTRKQFPNTPAQLVVRTERRVFANYQTVKSNKQIISKPLEMKGLSVRLDKRLYNRFTQNSIDLFSSRKNHLQTATFAMYDKLREMFSKYDVSDPEIFERNNVLYISIPFNTPEILSKNEDVLGIDRGIRRLVATSDGLIIKGNEFQRHTRKQNYLKRCLQSKGTKSAKRHLKKVRNKQRHFSDNYCHLVANEILKTDKDILVLENLKKIKVKTSRNKKGFKKKNHNRSFSQIPLYRFQFILTYKAQLLGKRVATVSPFMTSQQDCRGLKNGRRVGCRYYAVDGRQLDADVNAGVNIRNRYLKSSLSTYPTNGSVLVGRAFFNRPIVSAVHRKVSNTNRDNPLRSRGGS